MVVHCPISFILMLTRLQLCCYCYGPLMVVVLCALLAIDVALLALLYAIWWSWPCRHYLKCYDDLCSWFMWSMNICIYIWSNVKVCVLSMYVRRSCREWVCAYMCSIRIDSWLFLLDYMSCDGIVMYRIT